ncbi:hypothetical protein PYW08_008008 [Mythimna loreyi]|uniref:Uncharacterized protein n=1 Tax=Mythimna loreyi TaxID=667449 RepID=A0ACC2QF66_9NEOP|nr:hypothetical protein PYW08_008008 [Mythimna loreyi]
MFKKLGLLVILLTSLQVSARYKSVEQDLVDNVINPESMEVSPSSSRIVSGWEAQPGQHPHHAALHLVNSTLTAIRLCGGSIISKEWILTTAPCVVAVDLAIVRVGVVSINDNNPENMFLTSEWYMHPAFNPNISIVNYYQSNGVALIKLQRPLVYSRLIKRIRLQSSADADRNYDGLQVYASGHGRISNIGDNSAVLRWVYLRAISNTECRSSYSSGVYGISICARYFNVTSQSICKNDLGGPLVHVESDGVPTLIGVAYRVSDGSCESDRPTAYYRPGAFLSWFEEVTGIDFENIQDEDDNESTLADTTTIPTIITNPTTTETPTTTTNLSTSTDSDLEEFTTEDNTTLPPEDTEDTEEELTTEDNTTLPPKDTEDTEEEDNQDVSQLSKRRSVNVNVKVLTNIKQT